MTPDQPMRMVMDSSSTTIEGVPAHNPVRRLLYSCGFRKQTASGNWELPRTLPPAMRIARIADLIRILHLNRIPLAIDDRRPAPAGLRENRARLAEIYSGPWSFGTGHQPYVMAVAATVQVRGLPVREYTVEPGALTEDPAAASGVRVKARTGSLELADGRAVSWDEAAGWRDHATGQPLPISQVAQPAEVATAIAALPVPSHVVSGRDPAHLDPRFEHALAVYRDHPGTQALQTTDTVNGSGPYRLLPGHVQAIQQWQPPTPSPPRWETTSLISTEAADRIAGAWPSAVGRSPLTSYRPPSARAQRQLRQAHQHRQQQPGRQAQQGHHDVA